MTVDQLIKALQKYPGRMRVKFAYDCAVCCEDIVHVAMWRPTAYLCDDPKKADVCVCLFEQSSYEERLRDDDRRVVD